MPVLVRPTTRVHESYQAAVAEYQAEGGYPDFDGLDVTTSAAFARHVERLRRDPVRRTDEVSRRLHTLRLSANCVSIFSSSPVSGTRDNRA
ncbi:MAG: hypothetical protein ACRDQ7_08125 [Haloechinothrix sp.]